LQHRKKVELPFYYSREEKLFHLVAEMNDEPGDLASLLAALKSKVTLIGHTGYSVGGGRAVFSAFGRIVSPSDTPESIQKLVAKLDGVLECEVTPGNKGLLVDSFHHGLQTYDGEPGLLLPTRVLVSTFERMERRFGSGAKIILYEQGRDYAKSRWSLLKAAVPDANTRMDEVAAIVGAVGWAVVGISYGQGGKTMKLVNKECFECTGRTRGNGCDFLRGMAVGLAEAVFGREMTGVETRCLLSGGKACEFVVSARDGLPLVSIARN